jgi:hypothetical protein
MSEPVPRPWRSVRLPQAVTAVALAVSLPLYLRMPLWCDLTLYDLAARNLLEGGVHYRDVFDTNLPGFAWALTGVRWLFGFGAVALRCVDLAVVTAIVLLIDRVAKRGGATPAARWWAIAGAALLYPSAVEMAHAQRDTWMALPAVAALLLRLRRAGAEGTTPGRAFAASALEGALWGAAVWIKPHCVLMAAGVWAVTARRVAGACRRPWAGVAADLLGNIAGGLAVGLAGVAWLVWSGAWPYFREMLTVWAPEYNAKAREEFDMRIYQELHWFPPWSLWLIPTVPLAVLSILDAVPWAGRPAGDAAARPGPVGRLLPGWLWDRGAGPDARFARAALAALYLVWAVQSFVIQRGFVYAHMTELFLMLGLWAAHRYALPAVILLWLILTSGLWLVGDVYQPVHLWTYEIARHDNPPTTDLDPEHYVVRYPLADARRLRLWPDCWRTGLTDREQYALWDRTKRITVHEAVIDWEELDDVAQFLRSKGVKDGEVIAWHDSPHAVYLMLGIKPGVRYMHSNTAQSLGLPARDRVQAELAATAGTARFAVSDLEFAALGQNAATRDEILGPPHTETDLLPLAVAPIHRREFPFNQPTVFRSRGGLGRYVVHALTPPFGDSNP